MPSPVPPRDRILAAAKSEFAQYGPAGARIDRIAANASTGKERLYAHFSSKEALFAAIAEQLVTDLAAETALRGDDLPGYVGRLFDSLMADPERLRLSIWLSLESGEDLVSSNLREANLTEIRRGQKSGHIDAHWNPYELLSVITHLAKSLAVLDDRRYGARRKGAAANQESLRSTAVEATKRLIAPTTTVEPGSPTTRRARRNPRTTAP
jgi:AcrR family transcriptional regulator